MAGGDQAPDPSSIAGDDFSTTLFQCCVCLDLLYKPIVLSCGHISCFWCVHKAMSGARDSHCAYCRQNYNHFPAICELLHRLLGKLEPVAYKRREKEVLEEEAQHEVFSPQFEGHTIPQASQSETEKSSGNHNARSRITLDDLLCPMCNELLYQPAVLNCGHVYCESCLIEMTEERIECKVCKSTHPGGFPNICLDLVHFLEESFPIEYASRREKVLSRKSQLQRGDSSSGTNQKTCMKNEVDLWLTEDMYNMNVGVGCDSCGLYPIIGKRYKCKDCKESIGFDLCESCYNTNSKLPGRFNQQHTPDHTFELDDSRLLSRIFIIRANSLAEEQEQDQEQENDGDDEEGMSRDGVDRV